jgi:hypothetical protein
LTGPRGSAAALELERRPETVFGELEICAVGLYNEVIAKLNCQIEMSPLTPGSRPNRFRGQETSAVIGLPRRGVSLMRLVEISSRLDTLIFSETTTKRPMDLSSIERAL